MLQADTRLIERRPRDEATGEVVSLVGKIDGLKMGDRYKRTKPAGDGRPKSSKKSTKVSDLDTYNLQKMKGHSLLSEDIAETIGIRYRPKTPETRESYELILAFLSEMLGEQPRDVMCGAADEILQVMKSDKFKEKEKKKECEELLGKLKDEKFAILSGLCRKITDFSFDDGSGDVGGGQQTHGDIDDTGVNVQFEESEEEEEGDDLVGEIQDDDNDDEAEDGVEAQHDSAIKTAADGSARGRRAKGEANERLHPREIDAYWMQRKLSKYFDDPVQAQSKAAEVLKILKIARDENEVETQLIVLLGFDLFDFIRILRHHRKMILYCTLLAQAQHQSDKMKIADKMKADPELAEVLRKLESSQNEAGDGANGEAFGKDKDATQQQDQEMGDEEEENIFANKTKLLDLEDLSFQQGSHFMANKRCQLPEGSFREFKKGYEVIHVPALKPKPFDPDEVSIHRLGCRNKLI